MGAESWPVLTLQEQEPITMDLKLNRRIVPIQEVKVIRNISVPKVMPDGVMTIQRQSRKLLYVL